MKSPLLSSNLSSRTLSPSLFTLSAQSITHSKLFPNHPSLLPLLSSKPQFANRRHLLTLCSSNSSIQSDDANSKSEPSLAQQSNCAENQWNLVAVTNPNFPPFVFPRPSKFSLGDQALFLLTFIACTASVSFVSFVAAAVPTLYAMGRAANSLAKLADTAREELPSTMAAIRLSGMEISDLTLELSDLSQEISEGVNKSAQVVQAAEVGIRQIGALARQQTLSMIEERASLPTISLQPVVSGAAKKTSHAVGYATRTFMNIISRGEFNSESKNNDLVDRSEI